MVVWTFWSVRIVKHGLEKWQLVYSQSTRTYYTHFITSFQRFKWRPGKVFEKSHFPSSKITPYVMLHNLFPPQFCAPSAQSLGSRKKAKAEQVEARHKHLVCENGQLLNVFSITSRCYSRASVRFEPRLLRVSATNWDLFVVCWEGQVVCFAWCPSAVAGPCFMAKLSEIGNCM